jgi:DNA invertase Pin-like site-specific DNA recombinase
MKIRIVVLGPFSPSSPRRHPNSDLDRPPGALRGRPAGHRPGTARRGRGADGDRAAGVYKGRPPGVDRAQVRELRRQDMRPGAIAKTLGCRRATVYNVLGDTTTHGPLDAAE